MYIEKTEGRLFVCSDLHGSIDVLHKMLKDVGFQSQEDLLIHCGDLIDRGAKSKETFEFFVNDTGDSYISLRGNHDQFLADMVEKGDPSGNWVYYNGGQWALHEEPWVLKSMAEAANKLPLHLTVDFHGQRYGFVHAEVPVEFPTWDAFTKAVDADTTEVLARRAMWSRDMINGGSSHPLPDVKYAFNGHSVVDRPSFLHNRVYIDLGYVFKRLFCLIEILPSGDLKVIFRDKYAPRTLKEPFCIMED